MIMFKKPVSKKENSIYESFVKVGLEKLNKILIEKEIGIFTSFLIYKI